MTILKLLLFAVIVVAASSQPCPTWFIRNSDKCVCGQLISKYLQCSNSTNRTEIMANFCLTYDNNTENFGTCPYNTQTGLVTLTKVPYDISKLNDMMCGPLNRTGLLCSRCKPGLGPAVFSYYRECMECLPQPYGWLLFFVRLTVPLTLLCVLVIVLRINLATPALNGLALVVQVMIAVTNNSPYSLGELKNHFSILKILADVFGLFNMDFFDYTIPSFCISPAMSTHNVLALDYLVAIYPILFTVAVYLLITQHDRGCKVLVYCWRPFRRCCAKFRRSWDIKDSVISAFTTFLIFSFSKFCFLSVNLLKPVVIYTKFVNQSSMIRFYFGADVEPVNYIPYALLASVIAIILVLLPTLFLLFYQNYYFQQCLSICKINCILLHELAKITQAPFKDGITSGTRDYRWFAGLYLLLRIIFIAFSNIRFYTITNQTILIVMLTLLVELRPYKDNRYNFLNASFFIVFVICFVWISYIKDFLDEGGLWFYAVIAPVAYLLLYICCLLVYGVVKKCCSKCSLRKQASERPMACDNDEVPHRMDQPEEYKPLLPSSQ